MASMECSCACDWDAERFVWFRSTVRTARKSYRCCECSDTIVPGQRYEYAVGQHIGQQIETYRTCLPCAGIRRDYACGTYGGELRYIVQECLGIDYLTGKTDGEVKT